MDFFKSVLPPLPKLPKLKKLRQWNGGSLLSLNQFPNLPAAFNLGSGGGGITSASTSTAPTSASSVPRGDFTRQQHHPAPPRKQQHMRHSSDISIISAAVSSRTPADYSHRDNLGLYALKCDRSAAKRGILLNLPRKITQAVGSEPSGVPPPATMVHEKFSPCKRRPVIVSNELPVIKPPPRRRKRPPANENRMNQPPGQHQPDMDLSRWQKNSSELFRIVERESASAARARSAGGVGLMLTKKPHRAVPPKRNTFFDAPTTSSSDGAVVELVEQVKAQSVDNLLAMRYHRRRRGAFAEPERTREESDSESDRQVQSLRIHQHHQNHHHLHHRRTSSAVNGKVTPSVATDQPIPHQLVNAPQRNIQPPSVAISVPTTAAVGTPSHPFPLDRACDFSIDNNSDEIEIRFRKGYSTDESSETVTTVAVKLDDNSEPRSANPDKLPLPPRVVQLRRVDTGPTNRAKLAGSPTRTVSKTDPDVTVVQTDSSTRQFVPLAEVLRKSIDSAELKRKWINDFLSQGSESNDPEQGFKTKLGGSNVLEPFVPQLDIVQRMDRQLEELEGKECQPANTRRQGSNGSVDIFRRTNCDFEEFDELFTSADRSDQSGGRKTVKLSEQITYIDRSSTTSNLCFSSSSFSCASMEDGKPSLPSSAPPSLPPPPPPPPPPHLPVPANGAKVCMDGDKHGKPQPTGEEKSIAPSEPPGRCLSGYKSTVKIQDYSSKHLQRVRYLSSPSPSRSSVVELHTKNNHLLTDSGSETDPITDNSQCRNVNSNIVLPLNVRNHENSNERIDEFSASNDKRQQQGHDTLLRADSDQYRQIHLVDEQHEYSTKTRPDAQRINTVAPLSHPGSSEKLPKIKHCAVEQRRLNHDVKPDRHPEPTGNIGIRSVLPDYSEYYNEEGVIII